MSKLTSTHHQKEISTLNPLQVYLAQVGKYPLLEPHEEYELAVKFYEHGDREAAERLVTSNLRFVVKIAMDFSNSQTSVMDLIQEGNYGLMQAVKKFNPYKGVKLTTYSSWWIKAYILKFIMENKSQVKIGTTEAQRKLFFTLKKETERLLKEYSEVDTKMLAEHFHVEEKDVEDMQKRLSHRDFYLDAPLNDQESKTHKDLLVDEKKSVDELIAELEIKDVFEEHLLEFEKTLKDRELEIFKERLLSENPISLQELGTRYGISRERIRQVETKILQNLKEFVSKKGILSS